MDWIGLVGLGARYGGDWLVWEQVMRWIDWGESKVQWLAAVNTIIECIVVPYDV
jgi:hypothetical protein